jgi:hypothetical protein
MPDTGYRILDAGCLKGSHLKPRVKLQIDEGMWNGFDFYLYLDRINRIIRNFFACGEGLFGRRPHYPSDPVDPVQLFSLK